MADRRHKDADWTIDIDKSNRVEWGGAQTAVLMDIRDELKALNSIFNCVNFLGMPAVLRQVAANTKKPTRRRKVKT